MTLSEDQVCTVLDELRLGSTATVGSSRCHSTYGFGDDSFSVTDFDEGRTYEARLSEQDMREIIARNPEAFEPLCSEPHQRAFREALDLGDEATALEALDRWERSIEHPSPDVGVWRTILSSPDQPATPKQLAAIRERLRDVTAYHLFMKTVDWVVDVDSGRRGVAFIDRLAAIVGECEGLYEVRAKFQAMAGNFEAAVDDLERELARLSESHWKRERLQSLIAHQRTQATEAGTR